MTETARDAIHNLLLSGILNEWDGEDYHQKFDALIARLERVKELEQVLRAIRTRARMAQGTDGSVGHEAEAYMLRDIMRDLEGLARLALGEEKHDVRVKEMGGGRQLADPLRWARENDRKAHG